MKPRDSTAAWGTDAEAKVRQPDDPFFKKFAAEASRMQIAVDVFSFWCSPWLLRHSCDAPLCAAQAVHRLWHLDCSTSQPASAAGLVSSPRLPAPSRLLQEATSVRSQTACRQASKLTTMVCLQRTEYRPGQPGGAVAVHVRAAVLLPPLPPHQGRRSPGALPCYLVLHCLGVHPCRRWMPGLAWLLLQPAESGTLRCSSAVLHARRRC